MSFLVPQANTKFNITGPSKTSIYVSLFRASRFMLNLPRKPLSGSFRGRKEQGATRNLTADQKYQSINRLAGKPPNIPWAGNDHEQKDMVPYQAIIQVEFKQLTPPGNQLFLTNRSLSGK